MKKRLGVIFGFVLVFSGAAALVGHYANAGPTVRVGRPCKQANRRSLDQVDHAGFDGLLQKYVDQRGMVAYAKWKANPRDMQALDTYLAQLGCVNRRKKASKEARLAFWINAYNAVTIKGILREYPTTSIRNHTAHVVGYNIWNDLKLWVDGSYYSLNDMEHKILRKMGEPRIHFAVNCASIGCPPLVNRAFTAKNMETLLVFNAKRFFANRNNFQVNANSRTLFVSQLLQWYGRDFAVTPQQQLRQLRRYLPNAQNLAWIDRANFRVSYLNYDWNLNDQK